MNEITIAGNTYRYGKLNAIEQFHLERRILPLVFSAFPAFSSVMEEKGEDAVISWEEVIEKSKPLADASQACLMRTRNTLPEHAWAWFTESRGWNGRRSCPMAT